MSEGRDDIEALVQGQPIFLHDLGINVDLTPIKNLFMGGWCGGLVCGLYFARKVGRGLWRHCLKVFRLFGMASWWVYLRFTEELAEKAASKLQRLLKWDVEALPACREGGVDLFEVAQRWTRRCFMNRVSFMKQTRTLRFMKRFTSGLLCTMARWGPVWPWLFGLLQAWQWFESVEPFAGYFSFAQRFGFGVWR
jgi:hypothetical protein